MRAESFGDSHSSVGAVNKIASGEEKVHGGYSSTMYLKGKLLFTLPAGAGQIPKDQLERINIDICQSEITDVTAGLELCLHGATHQDILRKI
jgi:hypothetical protein